MDQSDGLQLINWVRDYYMNTFNNYALGEMTDNEKYELFCFSMLGMMYQEVLSEPEGYIAGLVKEQDLQQLGGTIKLGYEQAGGTPVE